MDMTKLLNNIIGPHFLWKVGFDLQMEIKKYLCNKVQFCYQPKEGSD